MNRYDLFIVPHTHWDREWYLPFQDFRIRLVRLMDKLLAILQDDLDYRCFTLDGQAIILEDVLDIQPEREAEIREHVQGGRLLVGPWYVLPDEFLVSPEALIRNLMLGYRVGQRFGPVMKVGYTPDPFGHISQLPQILRGFGIESTVFCRGLADEPTELLWVAPDGSYVLVIYLREGYYNAAHLPLDGEAFVKTVERLRDALAPYAATPNLLLMNGTDHMEPVPELPALIRYANERLEDAQLIHSSLPQYIEAVKQSLDFGLRAIHGELRSPKRHPILPGVLSARMWIKQRNAACQTLLEKWAEPFAAFAQISNPQPLLWRAWRTLLQNHPHDSICGCSTDQVHREMATRFDWAEQIGERVTRESLRVIADGVNTKDPAVVVFNPEAGPRTDVVEASLPLPEGLHGFVLQDAAGQEIPCQILRRHRKALVSLNLTPAEIAALSMQNGRILGMIVRDVALRVEGEIAYLDVTLATQGQRDLALGERARREVEELLAEGRVKRFRVRAHSPTIADVCFVAREVPGHGYKAYAIIEAESKPLPETSSIPFIANEFYRVEVNPADGTLTITDQTTGAVFVGANRLVDGGDRGDEYNTCPPARDLIVAQPAAPPTIALVEDGPARQTLRIEMVYRLPAALAEDRSGRSEAMVEVPITSCVSLSPGLPRIDLRTEVVNRARDHRLRVHFPTPIQTDRSWADGHFDVIARPLPPSVPPSTGGRDTADWVEQPVPTHPQRTFVDVSDGEIGLMVANRGLPEVEVIGENEGATVALTLLRCVGWLSRADLACRRGNAGPSLETPEAQCPGPHVFEYALIPHAGDWASVSRQAHFFNAPMRAVVTALHKGPLPPQLGFIHIEPAALVVSAIKGAEVGDGLIVRAHNIGREAVEGHLRLWRSFRGATLVNLNEEEIAELEVEGCEEITLPVRGGQIVTIKFQMGLSPRIRSLHKAR